MRSLLLPVLLALGSLANAQQPVYSVDHIEVFGIPQDEKVVETVIAANEKWQIVEMGDETSIYVSRSDGSLCSQMLIGRSPITEQALCLAFDPNDYQNPIQIEVDLPIALKGPANVRVVTARAKFISVTVLKK